MFHRLCIAAGAASLAHALTVPAVHAAAEAQTPSISGNSWVALGIIAGLVLLIALLIMGVLRVSAGRDTSAEDDEGGLPVFDSDDDERRRRR